jgi:16S rRNA (guanine966-N2)-methyltransferase
LNEVRIIGGMWKRRKLSFPNRPQLRPTPDRTRETVFNWLLHDIPGARCLDLFAGSGALGFEALSRGAAHATFVDKDPRVVAALHRNRDALGAADRCTVVRSPVMAWLRRQRDPWDIVFLDPPYSGDQLSPVTETLLERDLLPPGALLVVDLPSEEAVTHDHLKTLKQTTAGAAQVLLLTRT